MPAVWSIPLRRPTPWTTSKTSKEDVGHDCSPKKNQTPRFAGNQGVLGPLGTSRLERVDTICAYIDGKLGELLNRTEDQFEEKIERAWNANLITANERYDLHEIRKLRNSTENMRQQVDNLKTWQIAQGQYADLLPDTKDRLLYVGACIFKRLKRRQPLRRTAVPSHGLLDSCDRGLTRLTNASGSVESLRSISVPCESTSRPCALDSAFHTKCR